LKAVETPLSSRRQVTALLLQGGRLLLEYNESTGEIHRELTATAGALTGEACDVVVSYRGLAVSLAGEAPALGPVSELRYNMAVLAQVRTILEQVRRGEVGSVEALARLSKVEADAPRHSRWLAVLFLGAAAAGLAAILGAGPGDAAVVWVAAGLGLLVRQELGRRHFSLLALPLSAAFVGAVLGGLAIRLGWAESPELVLIVPALMLVPGPHLINGLFDLIDNHLPMSLARLGLAAGVLLASGLGVAVGVELTLPDSPTQGAARTGPLNLVLDMALAGVVTCGFAVFYNTPWAQVWMAAVGGMAGHGVRFLALELGCGLEAATFLGGLMVGAVSAWMARAGKLPVAVVAFAGAVTLMPGLHIYRALAGALQLARQPEQAVGELPGTGLQACLVVAGLALGTLLGARAGLALAERFAARGKSSTS
jgi:uncharacterized membrane protein YjjP (DUF1212 family)